MHSRFHSRLAGALILPALIVFGSCDQTSNIGQSVIDENIEILIDSAFTVSGSSVRNNNVQSRTLTQLLGDIDIDGYGSVQSYFVSQFMPAANIETDDVASIDSLRLIMRVPTGDFIGDSIAPMGITVYELERELPYPIYTDTSLDGFYNTSKPIGSSIYTMANFRLDSLSKTESTTYREFEVPLDVTLGRRLFEAYKADPASFSDPEVFTSRIFKGLAVQNSFGSGRLTRIGQSLLRLYYTRKFYSEELQRDSIQHLSGNYFGVTPEIVTNNQLSYTPSDKIERLVEQGEAIVAAPAAYEVKMRFPAPEILSRYNTNKAEFQLINTLTMSLPVELIDNNADITPPSYILLVLSKDKDKFFADNSLPDNLHSFYAAYNSSTQSYDFSDMRSYITELAEKENLEEADYTFTITPVTVTMTTNGSGYYQTTVVGSVTPDVSTASAARFLLDKAKIIFAYSKQSLNY
ncbi:MAG: DUF4270 domain-containing protein [Muribaculaceae bacterium]|nr:DUF4270 domain-containing protein [Muribaculaceae bacterium]